MNDHVSPTEALRAEVERLREENRKLRQGGPIARLHRRIALTLDRVIPPGLKTKLFSIAQAIIAAGPSAAAGFIPGLSQEQQDYLFHLFTVNPGKFFIASVLLLYLTWAARDAVNYREEPDDE